MIKAAIFVALTPFRHPLTLSPQNLRLVWADMGETFDVTAAKVKVLDMRKDVDYLNYTNFTSLLEDAHTTKISSPTIKDVWRNEAIIDEWDVEPYKDQIDIPEESTYEDISDPKESIIQSVILTYLTETSMASFQLQRGMSFTTISFLFVFGVEGPLTQIFDALPIKFFNFFLL